MTSIKDTCPYGIWTSPVTTDLVAGKTLRFGGVKTDGNHVYWNESRPFDKGRGVIVRADHDGIKEDVLPSPYSARSRVHEYGGGEFTVSEGHVYFVNSEDQDIYHRTPDGNITRITNSDNIRFAEITIDQTRNRLIAVAETHIKGQHHPDNTLVSVAKDGTIEPLNQDYDFYAFPTINPDGKTIAWISWNLPYMPWDNAALYVSDFLEDGSIGTPRQIAGGYESAVFQPEWGPDGRLYYISDESGIGNLYAFDGETSESICFSPAEFGRPLWSLGTKSYTFCDDYTIIAAPLKEGNLEIVKVDIERGDITPVKSTLRSFDNLVCMAGQIYGIGSTDFSPPAVFRLNETPKIIQPSADLTLCEEDISVGRVHKFPSSVENEDIYGIFYPPANTLYTGPEGDKPPLIMLVHGGPTGHADRGFKMKIQYWTSRGFAVFDLDYSGSYGYGRDYMERLNAQWGIRDVEDVRSSLEYLVKEDLVNKHALFISGGSAGGFTVLLALAELDNFAGGACAYGVADLVHLQDSTHKFEGGYLFGLMGIDTPENSNEYDKTVFIERSPTTKAHKISQPVIFFQGLEDKVVPPEQTRSMVATLKKQNLPVTEMEFEGEGHGFRMAETVKTVLEAEHGFYVKLLGLDEAKR